MSAFESVVESAWEPVGWSLVAFLFLCGMLALLHPRLFTALAARSSRWIESKQLLELFDARVDVDSYVLPYSRLLGAALFAVAVLLAISCS